MIVADAHAAGVVTALLIKDILIIAVVVWVVYRIVKAIGKKHSK